MSETAKTGSVDDSLWVGSPIRTGEGGPLVCDPTLQNPESAYVKLYDTSRHVLRSYRRESMHSTVVQINDAAAKAQAVDVFTEWCAGEEARTVREQIEAEREERRRKSVLRETALEEERAIAAEAAQTLAEIDGENDRCMKETLSTVGKRHAEAVVRHRKSLEEWRAVYLGCELATANGRETWCHRCKQPLEGRGALVCKSCRGIVCECGACLCTRHPIVS